MTDGFLLFKKILDKTGAVVVKYVYDAWGNHDVVVVDSAHEAIANENPFRYRGYYYDTETDLYYLHTRYYDPETGRFVNMDSLKYLKAKAVNGLNLYAYCKNNPVMFVDQFGNDAILVTAYNLDKGGLYVVGHSVLIIYGTAIDPKTNKEETGWWLTQFTGPISDKSKASIDLKFVATDDVTLQSYLDTNYETEIPMGFLSVDGYEKIRFAGDYSASLTEAVNVYNNGAQGIDNGYNGQYNLFTNNCWHYVKNLLSLGGASDFLKSYYANTTNIIPGFGALGTKVVSGVYALGAVVGSIVWTVGTAIYIGISSLIDGIRSLFS